MLGDAKKKIQRVVDLAEKLYEKVNELSRRVEATTETVNDTNARVSDVESELADQRAILEALAAEQGLDVEDIAGGAEEDVGEATGEREDTSDGSEDAAGQREDAAEEDADRSGENKDPTADAES